MLKIPVMANGDIDSAEGEGRARCHRLRRGHGRARGAGRPWIFREIAHFLATGETPAGTDAARSARHPAHATSNTCTRSGEASGVRIARKHLGWYARIGRRTMPSARS